MLQHTNLHEAPEWLTRIDKYLTRWMARNAVALLRISVGIVFLWFGLLKFFPELSPAEDLAARTIERLTFGVVQADLSLPLLATWEVVIGLGMISGRFLRPTLLLLFAQMLGTMTPLILFPTETFVAFPFVPTLEGQYILKNLILISAGLVIGGTVRGSKQSTEPERDPDRTPPLDSSR